MKLQCYACGAVVSSELPEDTVVRGTVECPECTEAKQAKQEKHTATGEEE